MPKNKKQWHAPTERKWDLFSKASPDEVIDLLNRYVNGEIQITTEQPNEQPKKKQGKKKKAKSTPLRIQPQPVTQERLLIESIACISFRLFLKYAKGEKPHSGRVAVWRSMLGVADVLEDLGRLPDYDCVQYRMEREVGDLVFDCRQYQVPGLGLLILPQEKPNPSDMADVPLLPALSQAFYKTIGKKRAAIAIKAAADELGISDGIR